MAPVRDPSSDGYGTYGDSEPVRTRVAISAARAARSEHQSPTTASRRFGRQMRASAS